MALREGATLPQGERARMSFALAQAIVATDPIRARALARMALDDVLAADETLARRIERRLEGKR